MSFILTGFRQDMGFRVFAFERRVTARSRIEFTVKADLGLIRRYQHPRTGTPAAVPKPAGAAGGHRGATHDGCQRRGNAGLDLHRRRDAQLRDRSGRRENRSRPQEKPPRRPTGESPGAAWRG